MYNVAQVLSSGFGRSWHEAVAIVQESAQQLSDGFTLPGPEDLHLDEMGTLTLGFGDESSENPVAALAGLLDSLLNGVEAPASLRDLVNENKGSSPAHATVASFSQALAFFERPNRVNDIRAVVGRLRGFREKSTPELEFERLREKVAKTSDSEPEKKEQKKDKKSPKLTKRQQAAVVALVAFGLFGTLGFRAGLHRNVGAIAGTIEGGVQNVVSAGLEQLGVSKAPSSEKAASEPVEAERASASGRGREATSPRAPQRSATSTSRQPMTSRPALDRVPERPSTNASAPESILPHPTSDHRPDRGAPAVAAAPAPGSDPSGVGPAAPAARGATGVPAPDEVFSSNDPEVKAPVLVRPQLPKKPAPGDDTGIFEMVVDENGDVAAINLISPQRRFHDRMLVAAAKAWKFRPATLDGQPVKYRIRIPIILSGMPGSS